MTELRRELAVHGLRLLVRTSALILAGVNHALALAVPESGASNSALLVCGYKIFGVVVPHWTLLLTVVLGGHIFRVIRRPRKWLTPTLCPMTTVRRRHGLER